MIAIVILSDFRDPLRMSSNYCLITEEEIIFISISLTTNDKEK